MAELRWAGLGTGQAGVKNALETGLGENYISLHVRYNILPRSHATQ